MSKAVKNNSKSQFKNLPLVTTVKIVYEGTKQNFKFDSWICGKDVLESSADGQDNHTDIGPDFKKFSKIS